MTCANNIIRASAIPTVESAPSRGTKSSLNSGIGNRKPSRGEMEGNEERPLCIAVRAKVHFICSIITSRTVTSPSSLLSLSLSSALWCNIQSRARYIHRIPFPPRTSYIPRRVTATKYVVPISMSSFTARRAR